MARYELNDMASGSVWKMLVKYTVPIIATSIFQSLYGVVDLALVSNILSNDGASAVSTASQVTRTVTIVAIGMSNGGNILVGQRFGHKDYELVKRTIVNFSLLFLLMGLAFSALFFLGSGPLVSLLRAPAYRDTVIYLAVCSLGFVFVFLYDAFAAILRALGNSRAPLDCVLLTTVMNIGLDLLFMKTFGMGVAGAALATVISQACSCLLAGSLLLKMKMLSRPRKLLPEREDSLRILKLGVPSAVSMSIVGITWFFVVSILNGYGVVVSAGTGIAAKIRDFLHLIMTSIGTGVVSVIAQNLGAGNCDRAKKIMYTAMKLSLMISVALTLIVELCAPILVSIFTKDAETAAVAVKDLRIEIVGEIFYAVILTYQSMMNGSGHTTFAMLNAITSGLFFRVPLAFLFNWLWGLPGVFIACALAPAVPIPLGVYFIRSGKWRKNEAITQR